MPAARSRVTSPKQLSLSLVIVLCLAVALLTGGLVSAFIRADVASLKRQVNNVDDQLWKLRNEEPSPQPSGTGSLSIAGDEFWKTYRSDTLNLEIKVPPGFTLGIETNDYVSFKKNDTESFSIRIQAEKPEGESLEEYHYFYMPSSSTGTLGNQEARIFVHPKNNCDGPGCGLPSITYTTKYGYSFYNLSFYGQDLSINADEKNVIESFKFLR